MGKSPLRDYVTCNSTETTVLNCAPSAPVWERGAWGGLAFSGLSPSSHKEGPPPRGVATSPPQAVGEGRGS